MATATREAFGQALKDIVVEHKDVIVLDADLSPATKTCYAKKERPQQFFNAGIAEANMVGMGAGLAVQGLKPFVSSFAMFLAGRAFEQIRNSVAYPHLNVKLCATHAGLTVGEDGATHQCNEDIALMRVLPGMVVLQPCDAMETKEMIKFMVHYHGPVYLRTSRYAVDDVFDSHYKFCLGDIVPVIKGTKIALLASGIMVNEGKKAIEILNKHHIYPSLYNVHTIKPLNLERLEKINSTYDVIITLEEHSIIGGLYSAVCECITSNNVYPIGIRDTFGESGTPTELMKKYEIDKNAIVSYVLTIVSKSTRNDHENIPRRF